MINDAIQTMIKKYRCQTREDYELALHEIIQEICLLALWRAKFFEHAAFYGGTALRILYGLDRFSEDLDFTLLRPEPQFTLKPYFSAIISELRSFGFDVAVIQKKYKQKDSQVVSAFVKADTLFHLLQVGFSGKAQQGRVIRIKFEVDRDPPTGFFTEAKYVLQPIPFSIVTLKPEDLFARKMHALLFRRWAQRVKGRDWYDFIWYVGQRIPVNLNHLIERIRQSEEKSKDWTLSKVECLNIIRQRIEQVDFEQAIADVRPFVRDLSSLTLWSKDFFLELTKRLQFVGAE